MSQDLVIERVLFVAPQVHVFQIPPRATAQGHIAASWTQDADRHIFTGRLRVLEEAFVSSTLPSTPGVVLAERPDQQQQQQPLIRVVLEDATTGELFAASPYRSTDAVEPALDSSRFFALTVRGDDAGKRAVLGIGFEDRSEAFDFAVTLQDAARTSGIAATAAPSHRSTDIAPVRADYRLKEGEKITVNLPGSRRRAADAPGRPKAESLSLISPPPLQLGLTTGLRHPSATKVSPSAAELGFDDGEFGEFA